ncbi:hypothetical protein MAR_015997 [Mya arenaria]|uniref:Uncharacterized protein n=1 Tax=Mya arenaria TaxID=6604 RepID=A0ABY7FIK9_MYAAR|nr:hypothetical protein MAR_015997 [Mya arenaria]
MGQNIGFLEVGGDRVFRPVDTKCIPICSNWKEKGWVFNCDGDNTACDWQCSAQRKACPEGLTRGTKYYSIRQWRKTTSKRGKD